MSSCIEDLKQIQLQLNRLANQNLHSAGLTLQQATLLIKINHLPCPQVSISQIQELMQLAQSTTVELVKRMVDKNLLAYHTDSQDKRVKLVQITKHGQARLRQVTAQMQQNEKELLSPLSPWQARTFRRLVHQIARGHTHQEIDR